MPLTWRQHGHSARADAALAEIRISIDLGSARAHGPSGARYRLRIELRDGSVIVEQGLASMRSAQERGRELYAHILQKEFVRVTG